MAAGHADDVAHRTTDELEAALDELRAAPADHGRVELVVRRPATGEREVLTEGTLDPVEGLVGDNWSVRGSRMTSDGSAHPGMQLNVINARLSALVAVDPDRRALAGDQLHVDLDLSEANLPPGTRLAVGSAVIEVTPEPHRGLPQVRGAVRPRGDAVRELAGGIGAPAPGAEREGRRSRHRAARRRDPQAVTRLDPQPR